MQIIRRPLRDFPSGPVVKNLPHGVGDPGLIPGQGTKSPHALGQQSWCAVPRGRGPQWKFIVLQLRPDAAKI